MKGKSRKAQAAAIAEVVEKGVTKPPLNFVVDLEPSTSRKSSGSGSSGSAFLGNPAATTTVSTAVLTLEEARMMMILVSVV